MTTILVILCAALLTALWWLVAAERRRVRRYLLSDGEQAPATVVFVRQGSRRQGALVATFLDNRGHRRTLVKKGARAGDRYLAHERAVVVFDPRWPGRDDRMLLGFGVEPTRWHRVEFDGRSAGRARTHI